MSRCFPFPPPGYERKTKADDTDLLKKEKHREKKHKKDKKDKDKKEGKEKREKERSDEKHREKKDKKDKHRDKKKDKEKDRDKEKHKSDLVLSDEKKVVGSLDSRVHKPGEKSKDRENDRNSTLAEKTSGGRSAGHNGISVSENNHQISETKSFKYAPDLGRKSMDEERRTSNQLPDKIVGAERKKDGGLVKLAAKSGGPLQDSKEKSKEKPPLDSRMDGRGVIDFARSSGNTLVSNSGVVQNRVGGILKPLEKKVEQKVDGKEKVREKEGDGRKREKRKEKDREKPVLMDMDRENKKKGEIMKAISEEKHIQVTGIKNGSENHMLNPSGKDGNSKDLAVAQSDRFHNIMKDSIHHAATVNNNVKKRKDLGLNGIYDERVTGPNKMARTTASPHPFSENGRSLEPCQNSAAIVPRTQQPPPDTQVERSHSLSSDDSQKPPMKIKVNVKECKINGTVADPCTESSRETTAKAERKSTTHVKAPHPDSKYLNQVLSVPKMDEWSEHVDQEWLSSSNSSSTREPEVKSSGNDETPQVWAKALWLEPVDIYALPYVIPH